MFTEMNDILTVDEVRELLYVGKNTVYQLLNSGELRGFQIGRTWRVPKESLTDYIIARCK